MASRFLFFHRFLKIKPISIFTFPKNSTPHLHNYLTPNPIKFTDIFNNPIAARIMARRNKSHGRVNLILSDDNPRFETIEDDLPKRKKWQTKKRLKEQRRREKRKRREANKRDPRRIRPKGKKIKKRFATAEERIKYKIEKALEKSKYEQSLETVRRFIAISEKELELYYRHVALYGDPNTRNSDLVIGDMEKRPCNMETGSLVSNNEVSCLTSDDTSTDLSDAEIDSDDHMCTGAEGSDNEVMESEIDSNGEELSESELDIEDEESSSRSLN